MRTLDRLTRDVREQIKSEEIALQKARMAESRVGVGSLLDIKDGAKEVIHITEDDEDEEDLATSNVICMEDRTGEVIRRQQLLDMAYNVKLYEKDADDAVEGPEIKVLFVPEEEDEEWDKVMEETKAGDKSQETIRLETADNIVIVDLDEDSNAEEEEDGKPRAVKQFFNEKDNDDDLDDDRDLIAALESEINLIQRKASDDRLEQDDGGTPMSFGATAETAKLVVRAQSIAGSIGSIGVENVSVVSSAKGKSKPPPSSSDSRKSSMPSKKQITTTSKSKTSDRKQKKVSKKSLPSNAQKSPVWKSPSRQAKSQQKKKTDGTETTGSGHADNEDEDDDDYVNQDDEEEEDDHVEDRERDGESRVSDKYSQKWVNK